MDTAKKIRTNIVPVGHSTGWLQCRFGFSRLMHNRTMLQSSASAVEHCTNPLDGYFEENGINLKYQNKFEHISIHLPDMKGFEQLNKTKKHCIAKTLSAYFSNTPCDNATIHADVVNDSKLQWLKEVGCPVAVENMGRTKNSGRLPIEVISLCREAKVPLVLDLQHAYEVSCDLYGPERHYEIAEQFARLAKKHCSITQLHVSGEISYLGQVRHSHSSLLFSTNRTQILDSLLRVKTILNGSLPPIILEGDYLPGLEERIYAKSRFKIQSELAVTNMNLELKLVQDVLNQNNIDILENKSGSLGR